MILTNLCKGARLESSVLPEGDTGQLDILSLWDHDALFTISIVYCDGI